jgi:hypothetical protein
MEHVEISISVYEYDRTNHTEETTVATCRICFEPTTTDDPLIRPCKCHSKVHTSCLERWRMGDLPMDEPNDTQRNRMCEVCHHRYRFVTNPMECSSCTTLYQRVHSDEYPGACAGKTFKLLMFHMMILIVISGIFYGADYTRYIGTHLNIIGEPYRIYYDLSIASYAFMTYLLQLFELRRLTRRGWMVYLKHIFTIVTPAHLWLLFHGTCCVAIGAYMWKSVVFDIICTIPFYHITCILHCEARQEVENSLRIGSIKEYREFVKMDYMDYGDI